MLLKSLYNSGHTHLAFESPLRSDNWRSFDFAIMRLRLFLPLIFPVELI